MPVFFFFLPGSCLVASFVCLFLFAYLLFRLYIFSCKLSPGFCCVCVKVAFISSVGLWFLALQKLEGFELPVQFNPVLCTWVTWSVSSPYANHHLDSHRLLTALSTSPCFCPELSWCGCWSCSIYVASADNLEGPHTTLESTCDFLWPMKPTDWNHTACLSSVAEKNRLRRPWAAVNMLCLHIWWTHVFGIHEACWEGKRLLLSNLARKQNNCCQFESWSSVLYVFWYFLTTGFCLLLFLYLFRSI